ncbi:MAG TPA: YbfB/YjiJ family MFS transporter [Stellaceae bacterium]|nr:YbfB/YjiJ family MFS transporter [Stellaceae bacterium]
MEQSFEAASPGGVAGPVRATVAALSANLVGIGLARFGYTPLIPALIAAHWFTPAASVSLGAANLFGYLLGALGARALASRAGLKASLRAMMALTAASFFACAWPLGFLWFFVWRVLSGMTGGGLMALAAPAVLPHIPPSRRGLAGGAIFTGVGLGIAASGTLVPLLVKAGLVETWLGLGLLALLMTMLAWNGWPPAPRDHRSRGDSNGEARRAVPPAGHSPDQVRGLKARRGLKAHPHEGAFPAHAPPATGRVLRALYLEYALNAVGLVPHMIFYVDFIARGLGRGLAVGARYWVLFGLGALVGPLLAGHLGDRIGFRAALRLAFIVETLAVALPLASVATPALAVSSFVVGAFVPGIVAVVIGRMRELVPRDPPGQRAAWSLCTTAFALGQALAAYGFAALYAKSANGYPLLFALAAASLLTALAVDLGAGRRVDR